MATTPGAGNRHAWLAWLARAGYAARGVVYLMVGGLALMAGFGSGGETTGSRGALQTLTDETWGMVALGAIGIGLVGHAVWRFMQSVLDADDHGTDGKGLVIRAGLLGSSVMYVLLAIYAFSLMTLSGGGAAAQADGAGAGAGGGQGGGAQEATAWLMSQPYGPWLVGIAGAIIVSVGVAQLVKAAKAKFQKWLVMSAGKLEKVSPICRTGLAARAVTFWIIGGFVIVAAWQADPQEARGLSGALNTLQAQAYGPWLLGAIAVGLIAFAAYSFIEARYRKIHPSAG
jgi:hypothetical protein